MVPNRSKCLKLSQNEEKSSYNREILPRSTPWYFFTSSYIFQFSQQKFPYSLKVFLVKLYMQLLKYLVFIFDAISLSLLLDIQKLFIFHFFFSVFLVFRIFFPDHQNTTKFTNFITCGRMIHLLLIGLIVYDWQRSFIGLYMIDRGHSISLFKSKQHLKFC